MTQIGFVFIQGFADWEFGHLAGSLAEWFDGKAVPLTPGVVEEEIAKMMSHQFPQ